MITIISYTPNLALALASVVNYDRKRCYSLERHLLMMLEAAFTIAMRIYNRPQVSSLVLKLRQSKVE